MKNLFLKIKQKFCKHDFKNIGFTFKNNDLLSLKGHCFDVLECKKCKLREIGYQRNLTEKEYESINN